MEGGPKCRCARGSPRWAQDRCGNQHAVVESRSELDGKSWVPVDMWVCWVPDPEDHADSRDQARARWSSGSRKQDLARVL